MGKGVTEGNGGTERKGGQVPGPLECLLREAFAKMGLPGWDPSSDLREFMDRLDRNRNNFPAWVTIVADRADGFLEAVDGFLEAVDGSPEDAELLNEIDRR
ncbi:MAG: hypothetical protein LBR80_08165 [Deltaproteobacteria bacterium]|jgi:hypothetical protein|nr:hypothetical protein [Deltaproteobacteria bacterium]